MEGIYIYCNLINGKKYVGQSVHIEKRLRMHLRENANQIIDRAIRKYTIENFYVIKIQYPKGKMNEMEKYYIEFFNTLASNGYNLTTGGDSDWQVSGETKRKIRKATKGKNNPMYGKTFSEEHKIKISEANKGKIRTEEMKKRISKGHIGIFHSEETKRKMSKFHKNKILSNEHKKKLSEVNKGEKHPNSKVTKEMVLDMRKMYKEGIKRKKIYKKYKHFIGFNGLQSIIYNNTWKHI